jgi:hypothetical protein
MPRSLTDREWDYLVGLIRAHKCTPFIGAGASVPTLPLGSELARQWAQKYEYPLADTSDLARVAQFMAIDSYEMFPKDTLQQQIQNVAPPKFVDDEPHALLADLDLPIYITTNYDPFMFEALKSRNKAVKRAFCRWNRAPQIAAQAPVFDGQYEPTPATPVVYHLHGYTELPQSMVLTEADYLDFLISFSRDQTLLPPPIRMALAGTALLFVGYSLADWNFRVILRGLVGSLGASLGYPGLAVQLPLSGLSDKEIERTEAYMTRYFEQIQKIRVSIFWGDARQFASELRERVLGTPASAREG